MVRRVDREPAAPRPERVAAFRTGLSAESRAAAYLIAKGYRIVARRFRSPVGEVDIVARRRRLLVFVEVKARSSLDAAAESLPPRQQRRIAAAAAGGVVLLEVPRAAVLRVTQTGHQMQQVVELVHKIPLHT
jgi:putative endonuclease